MVKRHGVFKHGDRVVVADQLEDHGGLVVNRLRHHTRTARKVGTVIRRSPHHAGGDAWFVRHDCGRFATYWATELRLLPPPPAPDTVLLRPAAPARHDEKPRAPQVRVRLRHSWHTGKLTKHHPTTGELVE